jgi:transposase
METNEIIERKNKAKSAKEYIKWNVLDLIYTKNLSAKEVSVVTGVPRPTVYGWIRKYKKGGPKLLIGKKKGGRRRSHITLDKENELLEGLINDSIKGLIITAKVVRKKIEEVVGHGVSKEVAYDLLHRHGWRKIAPRSFHPESNKQKQNEFKKNFSNSWQRPRKISTHQIQDQ